MTVKRSSYKVPARRWWGGEVSKMNIARHISYAVLAASSLMTAAQQPAAQPQPVQSQEVTPSAAAPNQVQTPQDAKPSDPQQAPASPTSTPPAGNLTSSGVDSLHYIIGAEDALQITVWREPTLSGTFPVRPDGMISLVLIGDLRAAGLTPTQLGSDISQRLRKFVQDPSVTVQVMAVNSQRIYLVGEVGHVGPVPLTAGLTPLQAIASAGGLSPFANAKHIYILRGTGQTQQKIPFNYKQALKGDNNQTITLRSGDTIVVP